MSSAIFARACGGYRHVVPVRLIGSVSDSYRPDATKQPYDAIIIGAGGSILAFVISDPTEAALVSKFPGFSLSSRTFV